MKAECLPKCLSFFLGAGGIVKHHYAVSASHLLGSIEMIFWQLTCKDKVACIEIQLQTPPPQKKTLKPTQDLG